MWLSSLSHLNKKAKDLDLFVISCDLVHATNSY